MLLYLYPGLIPLPFFYFSLFPLNSHCGEHCVFGYLNTFYCWSVFTFTCDECRFSVSLYFKFFFFFSVQRKIMSYNCQSGFPHNWDEYVWIIYWNKYMNLHWIYLVSTYARASAHTHTHTEKVDCHRNSASLAKSRKRSFIVNNFLAVMLVISCGAALPCGHLANHIQAIRSIHPATKYPLILFRVANRKKISRKRRRWNEIGEGKRDDERRRGEYRKKERREGKEEGELYWSKCLVVVESWFIKTFISSKCFYLINWDLLNCSAVILFFKSCLAFRSFCSFLKIPDTRWFAMAALFQTFRTWWQQIDLMLFFSLCNAQQTEGKD